MRIALMNIFDANVVQNIWEFIPPPDITIKVMHENHYVAPDEYIFVFPVGTTVGEVKEKTKGGRVAPGLVPK